MKATFAITEDGTVDSKVVQVIESGKTVLIGQEQIPFGNLLVWENSSPSDLTSRNIVRIEETDQPSGDIVTPVYCKVGDSAARHGWSVTTLTGQAKQKASHQAFLRARGAEYRGRFSDVYAADLEIDLIPEEVLGHLVDALISRCEALEAAVDANGGTVAADDEWTAILAARAAVKAAVPK